MIEFLTCPVHGLPAVVMNLMPQLSFLFGWVRGREA